MGVWGTSLYSGDFALDMRSVISAATQLPFDGDRVLEILCELEPEIANNPTNEDYNSFWLVVADQFSKRGIDCPQALRKAIQIIDDGKDIADLKDLGMIDADLRKRKKMLDSLRIALLTRPPKKRGHVLKRPRPYLKEIGDVVVYPTSKGESINPYMSQVQRVQINWKHDGWKAAIIVDRGKAFDFLPWYRPLVTIETFTQQPAIAQLKAVSWAYLNPGTLSAAHLKKMEFEQLFTLTIDQEKLNRAFPDMLSGFNFAIMDISICNALINRFDEG